MDPTLSLLMANQALVQRGDIIFDPFVGTGSLLIAAAKFGGSYFTVYTETSPRFITISFELLSMYFSVGFVMGTDIDYLMLHGKTKPTRVSQKVYCCKKKIHKN